MVNIKKSIILLISIAIIIVGVLQSCDSNSDVAQGLGTQTTDKKLHNIMLSDIEKNKIKKSSEFEQYVKATLELYSSLLKVDSILKKSNSTQDYIFIKNGEKIKKIDFDIDKNVIAETKAKTIELIEKFPEIRKIDRVQFIALANSAINQSEKLQKILINKRIGLNSKRNVRQKLSSNESITSYGTAWEAFLYATLYSNITQKECSGYVFGDGTAILYIYPNATNTSTSYPYPVYNQNLGGIDISIYDGNVVQSTFHTHPSWSTPLFSDNDYKAQSKYFPNSSLIIIYRGAASEYNFEYGFYIN